MAPFRFLRRLSSRLFGWERSKPPNPGHLRRVFSEAELAEPLDALATWLGQSRPRHVAANSEASVGGLEGRYGIRIPPDFRRYLLDVAPSDDLTDDELTTWWPLGRIRSLPDEYDYKIDDRGVAAEADTYLFFADYIIWCWAWAVCCSEGPNRGRVALIGGAPDGFVADSFTEFVERYLHDPAGMANRFPPHTAEDPA